MKKYCHTLSELLFIITITLFISVKGLVFYSHNHLGSFYVPIAFLTVLFVLLSYLIPMIFSKKAARIIFFSVYIFISCLMAIDSVYYSYVQKLPSVAQLGMVHQLNDITDTIIGLIKFENILMILDFPLWVFGYANREETEAKIMRSPLAEAYKKAKAVTLGGKTISAVLLSLTAAITAFVFIFPDFEPEYSENELFVYHATDLISALSPAEDTRVIDKSLYTEPDYSSSEYYSIAKGKNVIFIQIEAMQNFVVNREYNGQEITPFLNSLIGKETFYFDNYYYQIGGGNTSDAEFTVQNSLFAPESQAAYMFYPDKKFNSLASQLKDSGYESAYAFHGYIGSFWNREEAYPTQGFDGYFSLEDFEQTETIGMGLSDIELFSQSTEILKTLKEPFYSFFITLSSHYPYEIPEGETGLTLLEEDKGTLFGKYLQAMNYADRAIGTFINQLKECGLYSDSVFVIYGDHYAISTSDPENGPKVKNLLGRVYSIFDMFNVPMFIHLPGYEGGKTVSTAGGHIDVLPTILPLLGIRNEKSVMFGQNLLEIEDGIVCEQTHVSRGSFITKDTFYQKPHNNIKTNYSVYDKETLMRLNHEDFEDISQYAYDKITDCEVLILRDDILLK